MELRDPRSQALTEPWVGDDPEPDTARPPGALTAPLAAALRLALLAGPGVLAFFAGGYFEGPRLWAAVGAWMLLAGLAVAVPGPILPRTAPAILALAGLAAFTGWVLLSRDWAPLAGPAGEDGQRDALYLGGLAAATLAWRSRRWALAVEPLVALGVLAPIAYGISDRLLPGIVSMSHSASADGRLDQPLTYWNAMGALAAIGFVLCTRMAGDHLRPSALRAAAAGAAPILAVGLYVTFSRGAMGAAGCGLLVLALLAPTWAQLRAGAICLLSGGVAAAVASRLHGVATLGGTLAHREDEGALMLAVLAVLAVVAVALQAAAARGEQRVAIRVGPLPLRRSARVALAVLAVGLAAFPYAIAVSEKGNPTTSTPATAAGMQRLGSVGTNRYAYWRVAVRTFRAHPLKGTGAASFQVEWLRERPFPESVRDAHSLYLETLAELGIVGFLALLALFGGVAMAVVRVVRTDPGLGTGPAAALVVWAVHAGVDWDWEMPALTLVAVTLAGLVLARADRPQT